MECEWVVSGGAGSRRGDGADPWDVRDAGCTARSSAYIRRAKRTAFLCLLRKAIGSTMVHVDNKGIIDGLWKREMTCIGPKAKDADLWIAIWEELNNFRAKKMLLGVEHVEAHRTEKERQQMSFLEKIFTEGNEEADEQAKEEEMLDG